MEMTAAEKIKIIMTRKGVSMTEMAEKTGQSRQNLSNKMKRGNFNEGEMVAMAEALGCTVEIKFYNADGSLEL